MNIKKARIRMPFDANSFRAALLDKLIPPYQLSAQSGKAFFAYTHQKNTLVNKKLACPLIDPLIDTLGEQNYTNIIFGEVNQPELIESQKLPHEVCIREFLFSLLFLTRDSISDLQFLWSLQRPMPRLRLHWILFGVRTLLIANYISLKIRRVAQQASSAYVVVYYNAVMLGVVSAFRRLGKEAWDVQHGLIGATHAAYSNSEAFSIKTNLKPTGFLVWDETFGQYLENTLNAQWRSTNYLHLKAFCRSRDMIIGQQPTILYSLQWGTPVSIEVKDAIAQFPNIRWIFRKHPFEKSERADLNWINGLENAEITDSSLPLAEVLLCSHLHMTYNSSVVFEAAMLKIPSIFVQANDPQAFPSPNYETFEKIIRDGHATIIPAAKLVDSLKQLLP